MFAFRDCISKTLKGAAVFQTREPQAFIDDRPSLHTTAAMVDAGHRPGGVPRVPQARGGLVGESIKKEPGFRRNRAPGTPV